MIRFRSILSRIVVLHVVAVVITSVLMSVALSWLLNYSADAIHDKAMQEQAEAVAVPGSGIRPDGGLSPSTCRPTCRVCIPRPTDVTSYAVIDADPDHVLFSSLEGQRRAVSRRHRKPAMSNSCSAGLARPLCPAPASACPGDR